MDKFQVVFPDTTECIRLDYHKLTENDKRFILNELVLLLPETGEPAEHLWLLYYQKINIIITVVSDINFYDLKQEFIKAKQLNEAIGIVKKYRKDETSIRTLQFLYEIDCITIDRCDINEQEVI